MTLQATFVGGSVPQFATTAAISANTPAGIGNDDLLYALVFARSTINPPAGWTLVTSVDFANSVIALQRLALYKKDAVTASNSSSSFTWGQSVSARMGVTYVVAKHCTQVATATEAFSNQDTYSITPDALTATEDGELFLVGVSSIQGTNSTPVPQTGATLWHGGNPRDDMRLTGSYQTRNSGQSNSGVFDMGATGVTDNGMGAIVVRLQAVGVAGTVLDDAGAPAARTVRVYNRSTGALVNSGVSDSGTGLYEIGLNYTGEVQAVCLDDSGGTVYNDLILRTTPI